MTSVSIAWGICSRFEKEYQESRGGKMDRGREGDREKEKERERERGIQVCRSIGLPVGRVVTDMIGRINAASN
jgi:hypothetical protein